MWLGMDLRTGTKNTSLKENGLHAQNMLTILGSIVNMIGVTYMTLNEHENLHFDDEEDIYMSSKNYEANGYRHDLDSIIILH